MDCYQLSLEELVRDATRIITRTSFDPVISSIVYDSRCTTPGSLFFALPGSHVDGTAFILESIERGAVAIVHQDPLEPEHYREGISYIKTSDIRFTLSELSDRFYGHPSRALKVIGVTGTDGKTSTCEFLHQMLCEQGVVCGLSTTVSQDLGTGKIASPYRQSTPEAPIIHQMLAAARDHGCTHFVLECTSHALSTVTSRLRHVSLTGGIFTGISSEHLEFHGSWDSYVEAKLNIIRALPCETGVAVIPDDIPISQRINHIAPKRVIRVIESRSASPEPHTLLYHNQSISKEGITCSALWDGNVAGSVSTPILLPIFIRDAMLALAAAVSICDLDFERTLSTISHLAPVKGRLDLFTDPLGRTLIVDFAHTPDSFEQVLSGTRALFPGSRFIALFGSGGERDIKKRSGLGFVASRYCSTIILTEEDPRGESQESIISHILEGIEPCSKTTILIEYDRMRAMFLAAAVSKKGDVILFLGKGHERSIQRSHETIPWDEKVAVLSSFSMGLQEMFS